MGMGVGVVVEIMVETLVGTMVGTVIGMLVGVSVVTGAHAFAWRVLSTAAHASLMNFRRER